MGDINFLFRVLCTFVLFATFKMYNVTSPGILIGSLFLLDYLDCDVWNGTCMSWNFIRGKKIGPKEESYHTTDKILDVLTYMWFLAMFGNIFDTYTLTLLWSFTLYRFLGVCLYISTGNREMLMYFPDFVNSTMVVFLLKHYTFPHISTTEYGICIMMGMVFKLWFEHTNHSSKDKIYSELGFL